MKAPEISTVSATAPIILLAMLVFLPLTSMVSGETANLKPLTNADVLKMLESKIPESVILAKIEVSQTAFDTSTDAIIELNKRGVSEKLLSAMLNPKPGAVSVAPASAPPVAAPADKPSTLSYGTATGLVKKGVTTQREILELFGGPDLMTTDKDGTEVWMYDKKTTTVSTSAAASHTEEVKSEASQMAAYLGIPFIAGIGGAKERSKTDTTGSSENRGEYKSSSKTITFIIKFNEDKTVKDYAVRQATY